MKLSLVRAKKGEEEGDGEDDDDPSRGDSEGDMVFPRLALAAWDALCLFDREGGWGCYHTVKHITWDLSKYLLFQEACQLKQTLVQAWPAKIHIHISGFGQQL